MTTITAADIACRAGGRVEGDAYAIADAFSFDSRVVQPGACFVALRGSRDGHDFVPAAVEAGARIALVDHELALPFTIPAGHALVHVPDTLVALQAVARSLRSDRPDLHVVAVAGSTGKTSTKDLMSAVLASRGCHANADSYNNEFGLPITLCNTPETARVVVTEMGERFRGDLALLCDIAQPDVGVVTNVGLAHAEHLGGKLGTLAVLSELLQALPPSGCAVLNADDPMTPQLARTTRAEVVTVGERDSADYRMTAPLVDGRLRPSFRMLDHDFAVPLHGAHQAQNAALAVVVAHHVFGVPLADVAVELAAASRGKWRMELLETDDGITVLNDAYNANPASVDAALVALAHLDLPPGARRIAVLGDMRELGDHHDASHREAGERAAVLGIDVVVGVGGGGALIADAAAARGTATEVVDDAAGALSAIAPMLRTGDAVLVKASRALALERVADALVARGRALVAEDGAA